MGVDGVLVSFPVFKTERPARVVGGEFLHLFEVLGEVGPAGVERLEEAVVAGDGVTALASLHVDKARQEVGTTVQHLEGVDIHLSRRAQGGEIEVSNRDDDHHDGIDCQKAEVKFFADSEVG